MPLARMRRCMGRLSSRAACASGQSWGQALCTACSSRPRHRGAGPALASGQTVQRFRLGPRASAAHPVIKPLQGVHGYLRWQGEDGAHPTHDRMLAVSARDLLGWRRMWQQRVLKPLKIRDLPLLRVVRVVAQQHKGARRPLPSPPKQPPCPAKHSRSADFSVSLDWLHKAVGYVSRERRPCKGLGVGSPPSLERELSINSTQHSTLTHSTCGYAFRI